MATISNIVKQYTDKLSRVAAGNYGVLEAVESLLNDYMLIDDPSMADKSIAFPHVWIDPTDDRPIVTTVRALIGEYQDCLTGLSDDILIEYADGTSERVTFDTVDTELREYVADLQVQAVFLKTCLYPDELNLIERYRIEVQTRAQGAPPQIIEDYALAFENTNDPNQALINYYTMATESEIDPNDPYLNFSNIREYQGSIWGYAIGKIGDATLSFWDSIKAGVVTVGRVISSTVDGIVDGINYIGQKYITPYLSTFEVVGSGSGVLDVPIFQTVIPIDSSDTWISNALHALVGEENDEARFYPWNEYNYYINIDRTKLRDLVRRTVSTAVSKLIDGKAYRQNTEVIVPGWGNSSGLSLRLGKTIHEGVDAVLVQVLLTPSPEDANTMVQNPEGAARVVWSALKYGAGRNLCAVAPISTSPRRNVSTDAHWTTYAYDWIDLQATNLIDGLIEKNAYEPLVTEESPTLFPAQVRKLFQVLIYLNVVSKAAYADDALAFNTWIAGLYLPDNILPDEDYAQSVEPFNILEFSYDTFRPYAHTRILPTLVHVRTIEEQANKVYSAGVVAFAAITAVVLGIKIRSFRAKRRATSLKREEAARIAAQAALASPTPENVATYNRAFSGLQRTNRWNAALGIQNVGLLGLETTTSVGLLNSISTNQAADEISDGLTDISELIK